MRIAGFIRSERSPNVATNRCIYGQVGCLHGLTHSFLENRKRVIDKQCGDKHHVAVKPKTTSQPTDSWLAGCFGFNGPLRQYFS